jgi:hypothetical protein
MAAVRCFCLPIVVVVDPLFNVSCITGAKEMVLTAKQNVGALRVWLHKIDPIKLRTSI